LKELRPPKTVSNTLPYAAPCPQVLPTCLHNKFPLASSPKSCAGSTRQLQRNNQPRHRGRRQGSQRQRQCNIPGTRNTRPTQQLQSHPRRRRGGGASYHSADDRCCTTAPVVAHRIFRVYDCEGAAGFCFSIQTHGWGFVMNPFGVCLDEGGASGFEC